MHVARADEVTPLLKAQPWQQEVEIGKPWALGSNREQGHSWSHCQGHNWSHGDLSRRPGHGGQGEGANPGDLDRDPIWDSVTPGLRAVGLVNDADSGVNGEADKAATPGRAYRRRWAVLAAFCCISFLQGQVWNSWGPVAESARLVFGWGPSDVALLVVWGPVGFILCPLSVLLLDKRGLRSSLLATSLVVVLGCSLRAIPTADNATRKWLIHAGQLLNGVAGTTTMAAPPYLSAAWFPAKQRTTATAIASLIGYLGAASAFLLGPAVVPAPGPTPGPAELQLISKRIDIMLYAQAAYAGLLLVVVLLFLPALPPRPPSLSAAATRLPYRVALRKLAGSRRFWLIALAYGAASGVVGGWSGVLDVILSPNGVSQAKAGWVGFSCTTVGSFAGIIISRFADYFAGQLKAMLLVIYTAATLAAVWFTLMSYGNIPFLPFDTGSLYACTLLLGVSTNSSIPLFFELFVETTYPVPEGITCGIVTFLSNLFAGLLLVFLMVYPQDVLWLNWALVSSCVLTVFLVLLYREGYNRLQLEAVASS
ncbi:solute carrier family 49 member 4 homolog [Lampetra planeri]